MNTPRERMPLGGLWNSIQSWLFPILQDEIGALDEKHQQLGCLSQFADRLARAGQWLLGTKLLFLAAISFAVCLRHCVGTAARFSFSAANDTAHFLLLSFSPRSFIVRA